MGPRSGERIVTAAFAKQIAKIEKNIIKPEIITGNIDTIRDFNDVRDIVRAYTLATSSLCKDGEVYNLATGTGYTIEQIVQYFEELTSVKFNIEIEKSRERPSDVPILIGDSTKFRNATGWIPEIAIKTSLQDVLDYWRNYEKKEI